MRSSTNSVAMLDDDLFIEKLFGTGPKMGSLHNLLRFAYERTLTINTTAPGGNASLLTIGE
jgi:delta 1-pyrroline-5-carboxylate dehydrogenase